MKTKENYVAVGDKLMNEIDERKVNTWRIATIVLAVIFILFILSNQAQIQREKNAVNYKGIHMDRKLVGEIAKDFPRGTTFKVCNIETKDCLLVNKVK